MDASASNQDGGHESYVLRILDCQGQLYAYILSLVLNRDRARDLLQQTNVVLLEKESDFEPGSNFGAWACKVAYYEVLTYRRRFSRDRHLFNDQLLALIAEDAETLTAESEQRLDALRKCLSELSDAQRELVQARYSSGGSVQKIAEENQRKPGTVSVELHRIRNALANCINRRLESSSQA